MEITPETNSVTTVDKSSKMTSIVQSEGYFIQKNSVLGGLLSAKHYIILILLGLIILIRSTITTTIRDIESAKSKENKSNKVVVPPNADIENNPPKYEFEEKCRYYSRRDHYSDEDEYYPRRYVRKSRRYD